MRLPLDIRTLRSPHSAPSGGNVNILVGTCPPRNHLPLPLAPHKPITLKSPGGLDVRFREGWTASGVASFPSPLPLLLAVVVDQTCHCQ